MANSSNAINSSDTTRHIRESEISQRAMHPASHFIGEETESREVEWLVSKQQSWRLRWPAFLGAKSFIKCNSDVQKESEAKRKWNGNSRLAPTENMCVPRAWTRTCFSGFPFGTTWKRARRSRQPYLQRTPRISETQDKEATREWNTLQPEKSVPFVFALYKSQWTYFNILHNSRDNRGSDRVPVGLPFALAFVLQDKEPVLAEPSTLLPSGVSPCRLQTKGFLPCLPFFLQGLK